MGKTGRIWKIKAGYSPNEAEAFRKELEQLLAG
jgi:hypothetical protein